jgi:hypothetical protein
MGWQVFEYCLGFIQWVPAKSMPNGLVKAGGILGSNGVASPTPATSPKSTSNGGPGPAARTRMGLCLT